MVLPLLFLIFQKKQCVGSIYLGSQSRIKHVCLQFFRGIWNNPSSSEEYEIIQNFHNKYWSRKQSKITWQTKNQKMWPSKKRKDNKGDQVPPDSDVELSEKIF